MGSRLGSERANVLDNGVLGNSVAEQSKAALLVLNRVELTGAERAEWLDMLGLANFVRERAGLEPAQCPTCQHPVGKEWHGRRSDGRTFCRSVERAMRRAMRARQREAAA